MMKDNFPQEPSPENIETEIQELQRVLYEGWAGENFGKLPPDLRGEFLDVDMEAECGTDRQLAREKLQVLIEKLKNL